MLDAVSLLRHGMGPLAGVNPTTSASSEVAKGQLAELRDSLEVISAGGLRNNITKGDRRLADQNGLAGREQWRQPHSGSRAGQQRIRGIAHVSRPRSASSSAGQLLAALVRTRVRYRGACIGQVRRRMCLVVPGVVPQDLEDAPPSEGGPYRRRALTVDVKTAVSLPSFGSEVAQRRALRNQLGRAVGAPLHSRHSRSVRCNSR